MSIEVKIPSVGESITSGVLSVWHRKDGEQVQAGDALFTLETEKVSTEITAEMAGTLRHLAAEGEEVKIGQIVATIAEGAVAKPAPEAASEPDKSVKTAESGETPKPARAKKMEPAKSVSTASASRIEVTTPGKSERAPQLANLLETAREMSDEFRVEAAILSPAPAVPASTEKRATRKRLSPLRKKIAAQLVMAQQTAAILTTFNECDLGAVMDLRRRTQESFVKQHGVKLGLMSFFIKATVAALNAVPQINVRLEADELVENHYFDIGVAVGTERGLMVPVIRDCDRKSFADLEKEIAGFAEKARTGKITFDDLQGGVFTISNGGIYGSMLSTPILNPPQSGILGLHKIQDRPMAVGGQVVIRPMMYLALSYDHRVVDGREAVMFLVKIKECIEEPARLLLGM